MQQIKPPSVIHVADFCASYAGNFIASLRALGRECEGRGRRSVFVLPPAGRDYPWCRGLVAAGQIIHFVPPAPTVRTAKALASIARGENAEILHCHFRAYDVAAWIAQKLLRLTGRRLEVVWHAHSEIPAKGDVLRGLRNFVKHSCMGRSTRMIAVSEHVRRQAIAAGCLPARIQTIRNGVDLAWATGAARTRDQIACELAIPAGNRLLLSMGYNPLLKGVDLALSAVGDLVAEGLPLVLGIVGRERLGAYLAEQKADAAAWVRQIAPTDDIASFYQAAAVYLLPSRSEGFSYAVAEAMANKTPVVAADLPGVAWARSYPGAVFFRTGDATSLRDAVRSVLAWPAAEREDRLRESSRLVHENFDVRKWAEYVALFYWGPGSQTEQSLACRK
jgi:glycosyltransferase involved in cell wall biosynthesis